MLSDPIAALATPPGRSAIAVVRLSGDGAFEIAATGDRRGFAPIRPGKPASRPSTTLGRPIDRGLYICVSRST